MFKIATAIFDSDVFLSIRILNSKANKAHHSRRAAAERVRSSSKSQLRN
jgi:hypothetical protein